MSVWDMSLTCPRCENPIEQDFGVITCSRCQAVLFINMDGQVQVSGESEERSSPLMTEPVSEPHLPEFETPAPHFSAPAEEPVMDSPLEPAESSFNSPAPIAEPSVPISAGESFSDLNDYGNAEQDFGALSYSVQIEGIDTSAIREKLFDVLSDPKFQWDVNELTQQIENGRLLLHQLNPAKASILVRRLQDVSVTVSWEQKFL